jgi:hypothetical protein
VPGERPWNPVEPLQQRLAYINATAMAVSWNTYTSLPDEEAVVYFGTDAWDLDRTAPARESTFETSRTFSRHAILADLKPGTEYHYRVAHTNCFGCSTIPTYSFTTARAAGDCTPYAVAIVADMGLMGPDGLTNSTGEGAGGALLDDETNTIQSMVQSLDAYEHIVHIGDLAYADYFLKASTQGFYGPENVLTNATAIVENYERLNEAWYDQITPLTSGRPYMVAVGNHESNCNNGGVKDKANNISYTAQICMPGQTNFTAYAEHWNMPGKPGPSQNFWYSYDVGMVHYVVLSFETDFGEGLFGPDEVGGTGKQMSGPRGKVGEQIEWLRRDLANVDRKKTPWVLAFGHRPWYVGLADGVCEPCRQAFEGILYEGNVDVVFTGHDHIYSRSVPMFNHTADPAGYDNPRAPTYITNGAGGHYDGLDKLDSPLPPNIAHGVDMTYGWSRLTFANATHMRHEFVASRNSSVLDEFWLFRAREEGTCDCGEEQPDKSSGHGKGHEEGHGHGKGKGKRDVLARLDG